MNTQIKRITIGRKVKVRQGAIVGQDMGFLNWLCSDIIFTIASKITQNRYKLVAKGYGDSDDYGNGAIFAKRDDLLTSS